MIEKVKTVFLFLCPEALKLISDWITRGCYNC